MICLMNASEYQQPGVGSGNIFGGTDSSSSSESPDSPISEASTSLSNPSRPLTPTPTSTTGNNLDDLVASPLTGWKRQTLCDVINYVSPSGQIFTSKDSVVDHVKVTLGQTDFSEERIDLHFSEVGEKSPSLDYNQEVQNQPTEEPQKASEEDDDDDDRVSVPLTFIDMPPNIVDMKKRRARKSSKDFNRRRSSIKSRRSTNSSSASLDDYEDVNVTSPLTLELQEILSDVIKSVAERLDRVDEEEFEMSQFYEDNIKVGKHTPHFNDSDPKNMEANLHALEENNEELIKIAVNECDNEEAKFLNECDNDTPSNESNKSGCFSQDVSDVPSQNSLPDPMSQSEKDYLPDKGQRFCTEDNKNQLKPEHNLESDKNTADNAIHKSDHTIILEDVVINELDVSYLKSKFDTVVPAEIKTDLSPSPSNDVSSPPSNDVSSPPSNDVSSSPSNDVSSSIPTSSDVSSSPSNDVSSSPSNDVSSPSSNDVSSSIPTSSDVSLAPKESKASDVEVKVSQPENKPRAETFQSQLIGKKLILRRSTVDSPEVLKPSKNDDRFKRKRRTRSSSLSQHFVTCDIILQDSDKSVKGCETKTTKKRLASVDLDTSNHSINRKRRRLEQDVEESNDPDPLSGTSPPECDDEMIPLPESKYEDVNASEDFEDEIAACDDFEEVKIEIDDAASEKDSLDQIDPLAISDQDTCLTPTNLSTKDCKIDLVDLFQVTPLISYVCCGCTNNYSNEDYFSFHLKEKTMSRICCHCSWWTSRQIGLQNKIF